MLFEVFHSGSNKLWYFHLKARNGKIIAASEGYQNRSDIVQLHDDYFRDWEWRERNVAGRQANRKGNGGSEGESRA